VLVLSLLGTLLGRLWYLQVMAGETYAKAASENRTRKIVTAAPRGRLLDDLGRSLVRNRTSLVVTVDGAVVDRMKKADRAAMLGRLAKTLHMPITELQARIKPCGAGDKPPCWNGSPYQPVPVKKDVAPDVAFMIAEHQEDYAGVNAGPAPVREYRYGRLGSHLLGYISPVTPEELEQPKYKDKVEATDLIGRAGLEQTYDDVLRGRSGLQTVEVNRFGRVTSIVGDDEPQTGNDLVLSLDAKVQHVVEVALRDAIHAARSRTDGRGGVGGKPYRAPTAAGVVLEAQTGRVVAMASYPDYDPTVFVGGISQKEYAALTAESAKVPLISRAFQGLFAPGSTFKHVSTSAAVTGGLASLSGYFNCPGRLLVGNRLKSNFESRGEGTIDLHTTLVKSCDTVYYKFAIDEWNRDEARLNANQAPLEHLQKIARAFGFGHETGVDLPSERDGLIMDRTVKRKVWNQLKDDYCKGMNNPAFDPDRRALDKENCEEGFRYRLGDEANNYVGQGDVLVSPLQLAVSYAAIANGGTVYSPKLAKAVIGPDGKVLRRITPTVQGHLPVPADVQAYIRNALAEVPTAGTARTAFSGFDFSKLHVAGKTGTAQVSHKQDTSWFASFAPVENPKYVVVAMVEEAGTGGTVAAPAVRQIYEGIYGLAGKPAALANGQTPTKLPRVLRDGSVIAPRPAPVTPASPTPGAGATAFGDAALPVASAGRKPGARP
jgi:penicillin-binding protein 2